MNDQYNTLRPSSARSVDALIAAYNAKLKNVQPGTPACQALQSWFTLELNRILGRPPIPLLPDPPPPICGHVPRLAPVPIEHRQGAWDALEQGRVREFLYHAPEGAGLWLVLNNAPLLHALGGYEVALLEAYTGGRTNWRNWTSAELRQLFGACDRQRLLEAGDPLPGPGPYTLYRGVAGAGRVRRVRGLSWTGDRDRAHWFAQRFAAVLKQPDPGVYQIVVTAQHVRAYTNGRQEQEFLVEVPATVRPSRMA
jgi:hypothetical protein